jgi:CubicO group peptidase (beta-lactamase class C family)
MRCCFLFLIVLLNTSVFAQQDNFVITGRVTDEINNPLPSASVRLAKKTIGTITNSAGDFSLKLPGNLSNDTLVISFLGYEQRKLSVGDIKATQVIVIRMTQKMEMLQEVMVKPTDPLKLIQSAIERIPANYYSKPHISKGFYRLDTKKGEEHIMLSEAVFDIYNDGYTSKKGDEFKLIKSRHIQDERMPKEIIVGLTPKNLYDCDIIKQISQSGVFGKSGLKNHFFKLNRTIDYNGMDMYEISFDQKDGINESLYKGEMYIDVNSLAIISIHQALSPKGIRYAKFGNAGERTLAKLMGIDIEIKKDDLFVTYQKYDDRWVLSNAKATTIFNFKNERKFYDFPANINVDYVVTGIDTSGIIEFSGKESLGDNKWVHLQNTGIDKDFWKDYNIIVEDFNSDTVAKQMVARNESFNLKRLVLSKLKNFPKDKSARIDSILSFYYQKGIFNGSVLIKNKGKVILQKGYGIADKEKNMPATDTTQYRIGSLTKTFTSMLIQQLVAENKLTLLDTIGKFIPGYVHKEVTIEQLLTHRSGIPSYTNNFEHNIAVMTKTLELKDVVFKLCSDPLEFKSGTRFHYSNSGYTILAAVSEIVSGKKYGQLLNEKIFDPLQMKQSVFGMKSINSKGYWLNIPEPVYNIENITGAGGISSTVKDLLKWDEALYTDKLLPQKQLLQSFESRASYDDWDADYGYGWMIDRKLFRQSKKHKFIYHPGTDLGYCSMFVRQPDENNLIIMLSNAGDFPRFDITDLILEELN